MTVVRIGDTASSRIESVRDAGFVGSCLRRLSPEIPRIASVSRLDGAPRGEAHQSEGPPEVQPRPARTAEGHPSRLSRPFQRALPAFGAWFSPRLRPPPRFAP